MKIYNAENIFNGLKYYAIACDYSQIYANIGDKRIDVELWSKEDYTLEGARDIARLRAEEYLIDCETLEMIPSADYLIFKENTMRVKPMTESADKFLSDFGFGKNGLCYPFSDDDINEFCDTFLGIIKDYTFLVK